ncbi:MAG TPA: flagellar hook assembly protein FlgD [Rhizomicrobium sp.]|nr:flagellar hook assembly protein FlgD [Rhizomicrobium sp.]
MTTVAPTTSPVTATPTSAQQQLSSNFDTFLQLLTTQLQNQDPLSPMDSNQFTQQLVEFSQVEQQINTNDNLKTLIAQGANQTGAYAVSYLGKAVTVTNGNAALVNGQATWTYNLDATSAQTILTVTDANGQTVFSGPGETAAGTHRFTWDGAGSNGTTLPDGAYKLTVSAAAGDGSTVQSEVASSGVVTQVDMTGSAPQLMIGPMEIPLSDVAGVATL